MQFDLVIATNILLYYDVFEQSMAAANIAQDVAARRISPDQQPDLRAAEQSACGVGFTDVTYMSLPGIGDAGDRVIWYQRQYVRARSHQPRRPRRARSHSSCLRFG